MRYSFAFLKWVLSRYRRTAVVGLGIVLSLSCWVALDQPLGTKIWDFYTGEAIQSSAAVGPNGVVYFGTDSGKLYAFYPDGRGQWEFPTGDRIVASPAIGTDGTIYFGSYNGIFYAIAPEGVERWRFRANGPIASSAAIGSDGTICFGTLNNRLFALRPDGTKIWDLAASDPVIGSPAVDAWGTVYVPSADGVLAAIDLRSGNVKWEFEAPNRILSSPAIGADGSVYFGCFDGHLYALDHLGKKKWTFASGGPVRGSAVIGPDGMIYFGSDDRQLYALEPDGIKKWTFTVGKWIRSTPAVAADGTVYIGSYDHSLYAVGPDGAKKWEFVTDNNVTASAAVGADGTVYFGSWNGRFYAVRGGAALASSIWPRFHGGARQTGFRGQPSTPAPGPAPVVKTTRPQPAVESTAPKIVVKQEPGSVLGNWWRRIRSGRRSQSEPEPEPAVAPVAMAGSAPADSPVIPQTAFVSETTTKVMAAQPTTVTRPAAVMNTMTPLWEPPAKRTVANTASVKSATIPDGSGMTSVTTATVVRGATPAAVTMTNPLSDERERAYRRELEAMRDQVSNLEAELRAARAQPVTVPVSAPRVIADSHNLVTEMQSTSVTTITKSVESAKEREYRDQIAVMKSRADQLTADLARERDDVPSKPQVVRPAVSTRPGMLPMMRLISVDEPKEAPENTVVPPPVEEPVPEARSRPTLKDTRPPEADVQGVREIEEAWGETKEESSVSKSWFKRSRKEEETAGSSQPEVVTAREREYLPGLLQQTFARDRKSSVDLPPAQPVEVTASEREYQPGFFQRVFSGQDDGGVSVKQATTTALPNEAQPEIVTAKEREYQPGFFQRMFSRDVRSESVVVEDVKTESAPAPVPAKKTESVVPVTAVATNEAAKVIADSDAFVAEAPQKSKSLPMVKPKPEPKTVPQPKPVITESESRMEARITALEKHIVDLNAQLAQRDRDLSTAPPMVAISTPPESKPKSKPEPRKKAVTDDAGKTVPVASVHSETPTTEVATVIASSADLVAIQDEPRIEEVFVERTEPKTDSAKPATKTESKTTRTKTAAAEVRPTAVEVTERELQPGLLNRLFSRSDSNGTADSSSKADVIPEPTEVAVFEREYRPGVFQRMFMRGDSAGRSAVREESSRTATASASVAARSTVEKRTETAAESAIAAAPESKKKAVVAESGKTLPVAPVPAETVTTMAATVIADSADLVAAKDEPKIEEVFVERKELKTEALKPAETADSKMGSKKVAGEEGKPATVEVTEREPQPGLLNKLLTRGNGATGSSVSSSKVNETPALTGLTEPTEVAVSEREYRPGFFQRLFTRGDSDSRSAVREVSSRKTETSTSSANTGSEAKTEPASVSVATVPADAAAPAARKDAAAGELQPVADSKKPSGFDAKLAKLEERLSGMRDELDETQRERDDLKRQIGSDVEARVVAVPKKQGAKPDEYEKKSAVVAPTQADEGIDPAIQKAYGNKISQLESNLISLSEELASARVERARLREELKNARQAVPAASVATVPVAPVLPETEGIVGVEGTVIADSAKISRGENATAVIPQPEWLKQEVRSVIATADPWAQPPGTPSVVIDAGVPPTNEAPGNEAPGKSIVASPPPAVVELPEAPASEPEVTREDKSAKRRKPGFFSRLFGRGRDAAEEKIIPATNLVVIPPTVSTSGSANSKPTDAQLLGNDTGYGDGAVQTNFPRVAYTPSPGDSFFAPGVGNVTQLPGFPRRQPVLTPPPSRAMDPTKVSSNGGLKNVAVRDTTTVVPPDAGVTRVEDLAVNRPVVAIMSPPEGATLAGPVLDLRGLAQGDRRIAQVLVSLDGGPFEPAAGLERWSFQRPVAGDHVLVRVKAVDGSGRESPIVERTYGHHAMSRLVVEVAGEGSVSPDLNGRTLMVGKPYEITAVPAPGFEFAGWSGGANSTGAKLVFQMNANLFLRAEFRPAGETVTGITAGMKDTASMRGAYTGLLYPQEIMQADRSGDFELRVEDDGTFNGKIRLATSAAPLRGRFDATGRGSQTIDRPGAAPITIRFRRQADGERIIGFFDADGVPVVMRAYRAVDDGDTLVAIKPGRYTLVIPGPPDAAAAGVPAGDGFGEVRIDAGGHVKFSGELPDGSKVTQESRISANGVWPLYVPLYGGEGMLTGWISVTNHPTLDLHGDLRWIKPARPADRFYPEGFATRRFVFGSIYKPSHDDLNKRKGLAGVLLGGNLGRLVLGQDVAALPLTSPQRETLQQFDYQIDPDSGRVEGTFIHPETRQPTPFHGMLVQKRGWKSGYFMGADASGVVHLNGK